jgi:spore protease
MKHFFHTKANKNSPNFPCSTDLALEDTRFSHSIAKMRSFNVTSSTLDGKTSATLHIGSVTTLNKAHRRAAAQVCNDIISGLIDAFNLPSIAPVTVICLGNSSVTVDSLGYLCSKKIYATRHLQNEAPSLFTTLGGREISVIHPGVTAETGIDALEIAKWCQKDLKPSLVITIDALKAANVENLLSVIQISSGVAPGSGTDSTRPEISEKTVGVPVISIGAPTVISPSTLISDMENKPSIAPATRQNNKTHPHRTFKNIPSLLTVADCENAINTFSELISDAVNYTLLGTFLD